MKTHKSQHVRTLADHRWVFDSEWGAANFLSYRCSLLHNLFNFSCVDSSFVCSYGKLSDGLPQVGIPQTMTAGTDCVLFGGVGKLPNGNGHLVHNYLFREQNVVVKLAMGIIVDRETVSVRKEVTGELCVWITCMVLCLASCVCVCVRVFVFCFFVFQLIVDRTRAQVLKEALMELRIESHSHAAVTQRLLETHEATESRAQSWLSKWL